VSERRAARNYILTPVAIDSGGSFACQGPWPSGSTTRHRSRTGPASGTVFLPGTKIPLAADPATLTDGQKSGVFTGSTLIGTNFLRPYNIFGAACPPALQHHGPRTDLVGWSVFGPVMIAVTRRQP